jgi:hypothetical protein
MATKIIIKSSSAIGNTILYTHTDSTPLLITGITHKVSTPSAAAFGAQFSVTYNIYLAKKQIDGSYSYIKLDYPIQADKLVSGGTSKTSGSLYTNIVYIRPFANNFYYLQQANPTPGYTIDTYGSNELYEISKSKVVINTGDFIYCSIAGTYTENLVVFSSIITTTTIPQNKTYKGTLFKGVWVSGGSYYKNDTVVTNNDLYIALQANSDTVMNDNNWLVIKKRIVNINPLVLTELTPSIGTITPLVKQRLTVSGTLSNKLFIRPKVSGTLATSNGGNMSLRPLSANSNLISADTTETLTNKTVSSPTLLSNCITDVSNQTVTLTNTNSQPVTTPFMLFKPVTKTLIAGTNNITFNSTGGISFVCATTTTAGDSFSIVLPSASTSSGYVISFIVKMLAANQTVNFSTVKTSRTTTASTTANRTDRYLLVCDGTYWYCIQTNKGIV